MDAHRPRQHQAGSSHIITRDALENAIAAVAATGGSTNGVLHLLAIARELDIPLELEDFDSIAARTPIVADLKPAGRYVATDLHEAGGVGLVMRELVGAGLVAHEGSRGVDGRTLGEVRSRGVVQETPGQEVVVLRGRRIRLSRPAASRSCAGSLAPEGCGRQARRPASALYFTAAPRVSSTPRRTALPPSRRRGSRPATWSSSATKARPAAPACARCCTSTAALVGEGLGDEIALITDGRFLGGDAQRADGRPHHAGSRARRSARDRPRRRPDRARRREAACSTSTCRAEELERAPRRRGRRLRRATTKDKPSRSTRAQVSSAPEGAVTTVSRSNLQQTCRMERVACRMRSSFSTSAKRT